MNVKNILHKTEILFWTVLVDVMNNRRSARWIPAAVAVFLIAGVLGIARLAFPPSRGETVSQEAPVAVPGQPVSSVEPANQTAEQIEETWSTKAGQTNLLVILVDSLSSDSPALKGVWLIGRASAVPQLVFLPLYPSARKADAKLYSDRFQLDPNSRPAPEFLDFLTTKDIWWDHYLVMDETSLSELIALTDGVYAEGRMLSGPAAVATLLSAPDTPEAEIRAQAQIASELCRTAPELIRNADPVVLWGLLTHRMRSDYTREAVEAARQEFSQPGGSPACEFPTLREMTFRTGVD